MFDYTPLVLFIFPRPLIVVGLSSEVHLSNGSLSLLSLLLHSYLNPLFVSYTYL